MGSSDYFKHGSHNVICDICGKKRKAEQVRKTWKGLMACTVSNCWDRKHPYDSPLPVIHNEMKPVRDARPAQPTSSYTFVAFPAYWEECAINWEDMSSVWGSINKDDVD